MFRLGQPRSDLASISQRVLALENTYGTCVPRIGGLEHVYNRLVDRLDTLDSKIAKIETCVNALGEKQLDAIAGEDTEHKQDLSLYVEPPKALPGPSFPDASAPPIFGLLADEQKDSEEQIVSLTASMADGAPKYTEGMPASHGSLERVQGYEFHDLLGTPRTTPPGTPRRSPVAGSPSPDEPSWGEELPQISEQARSP